MATDIGIDVEIPYVKRDVAGNIPDHAQMFSWLPEFMDLQPGRVRDARTGSRTFSIATTGFEYAELLNPPEIDYQDRDQVTKVYFPRLEQLLKEQYVF